MSKFTPLITSIIGWLILPAGMSTASTDDEKGSPAEKVLNAKGLTRNDRKFLLEGESAAIEKYKQTQTVQAEFQAAVKRYAVITQYDESLEAMETQRQGLAQEIDSIQIQLNGTTDSYGQVRQLPIAQQASLRQQQAQDGAQINQINGQIQTFKAQAPKAEDRKNLAAEYDRQRKAYIDSVRELDVVMAPLLKKYHDLATDKAVVDALAELRRSTKLNFKLGPTDQVLAASRLIQDVKKTTALPGSKSTTKKKAKSK
jgi:vacuolar-type H+-ATPase subunit I/STV1